MISVFVYEYVTLRMLKPGIKQIGYSYALVATLTLWYRLEVFSDSYKD